MTSPLPSVRLPLVQGEGEHLVQDAVVLDLPSFSKFSINYPSQSTEVGRPIPPTPPPSDRAALSSSGSGTDESSLEDESGNEQETDNFDTSHSPTIPRLRPAIHAQSSSIPSHPRFFRAFSLPLPSQLGLLQHPHRSPTSPRMVPKTPGSDPTITSITAASQLKELSLELADSVQMVIQTMLQVSPSQVLDPAKEQFSACALAVPTPSMSAMFTAMKNLNYISANMNAFCTEDSDIEEEDLPPLFSMRRHNDFDIGELLQSTGDSLSGTASQSGVDLVIYHGDVGLKHVWVKGDESGISYLLSHIVRQVLTTAHRTDTLELGLFVRPLPKQQETPETDEDPFKETSPDGPLQCVVEILHRFGTTDPSSTMDIRMQPILSTLLLRRLLRKVGATLTQEQSTESGQSCRVTFTLETGTPVVETPTTITSADTDAISSEPSLEQLATFMESLKGKKVNLYASSKGSFAHHLTSYLTAWGMDVSHISGEAEIETPGEGIPPISDSALPTEGYTPTGIPTKVEPRLPKNTPPSFVFIDDDVNVLRERLQAIRSETAYPMNLNMRKRPSLAHHHRPRSSPQVARLTSTSLNPITPPPIILHFTSLSNFKLTRDIVQSTLVAYQGVPSPVPEVMIIPKPAGPRRFLTALHSAVTKPVVDPLFSPIATTPGTPSLLNGNSFFHNYSSSNASPNTNQKPATLHRPSGSRSNSDRSVKSTNVEAGASAHASSPLAIPDPAEYFSEAALKLGSSPSSGLVIQSPDGQPAGIFFHPKVRGASSKSSVAQTENDKDNTTATSSNRKSSFSKDSAASPMTFSSLHEVRNAQAGPGPSTMARLPSALKSNPSSPRIGALSPPPPENPPFSPTSSTASDTHPPLQSPTGQQRRSSGERKMSGNAVNTTPVAEARKTATPARRESSASLAPGSTLSATKKAKSPADGNIVPPISVLIVDDNPINRTVLSTFMKKKKIKFDVASNGEEAVEKWKTGEFHLILMDIQMPIMDGIAATSEIRRIEKQNAAAGYPPQTPDAGPPTPSDTSSGTRSTSSPYKSAVIIVALTASSLQTDRIAALTAGCNDFLTKPVSLQWLNNKLIEWGSIKALQMWADLTPSVGMPEARNVAEKLHVPKDKFSFSQSPSAKPVLIRPKPPKPARQPSLTSGNEPSPINVNGGELQLGGITEKDRLARRASTVPEILSPSSSATSSDNKRVGPPEEANSVETSAPQEEESTQQVHDTSAAVNPDGNSTVDEGGYDGR